MTNPDAARDRIRPSEDWHWNRWKLISLGVSLLAWAALATGAQALLGWFGRR